MPGASAQGGSSTTGHYITGQESPAWQQSLCRGGERMEDEGEQQGEDLGARNTSETGTSLGQVQRGPEGLLA